MFETLVPILARDVQISLVTNNLLQFGVKNDHFSKSGVAATELGRGGIFSWITMAHHQHNMNIGISFMGGFLSSGLLWNHPYDYSLNQILSQYLVPVKPS